MVRVGKKTERNKRGEYEEEEREAEMESQEIFISCDSVITTTEDVSQAWWHTPLNPALLEIKAGWSTK